MGSILRTEPEVAPTATVASVDTVELVIRRPPGGLRKRVEAAIGRRVRIENIVDWTGHWRGVRVIVNRPSKNALKLMSRMVRSRSVGCCVSRVDVAIDFTAESAHEADALADWLDRHLVLKWRSPKSRKIRFKDTIYWTDGRRARNLVCYPKAHNIVRLELRFLKAGAVKRAGLDRLEQLETIDLKKLVYHNLKAERLTDRHIIRVIRKTYKEDMVRHQNMAKRSYHPVVDLYRSRIPARVRSILKRIDAQSISSGRGTEKVDMEWLNIPDHATWH